MSSLPERADPADVEFTPPDAFSRVWPAFSVSLHETGKWAFAVYGPRQGYAAVCVDPDIQTLHADYADALQQVVNGMRNYWRNGDPGYVNGWDDERCSYDYTRAQTGVMPAAPTAPWESSDPSR